jgi:hypothetical protein
VTDTPLFADALLGLRSWRVIADADGEWLAAPHQNTRWPPGGQWLQAKCQLGHGAPAAGCDCGAHAWHPRKRTVRDVLAVRAAVAGVVEAKGAIEVHRDGFRAAKARPYALIAMPRSNPALIGRLAERYGTPIVEVSGPRALLTWCRENGVGMGEDVVAQLLGSAADSERRRARFRNRILGFHIP